MNRIAEPDETQLEFARLIPEIILASSSPNRRQLLEKGGCKVTVFLPEADESRTGDSPESIVMGIAERKIKAYLGSPEYDETRIAVAADTLVLISGRLLGKPEDEKDAFRILSELSGKRQRVISAIGIKCPGRDCSILADEADVVFRDLSPEEIKSYIAKGEWKGAAGGYRLQKTGYELVEKIDGDWTTVVGLPLKLIINHVSKLYKNNTDYSE